MSDDKVIDDKTISDARYAYIRLNESDETIESRMLDIAKDIWRRKLIFISIVLVALAVSLAVSASSTHLYRVEVLLYPIDSQSSNVSSLTGLSTIASLSGLDLDAGAGKKNEAIAILKSTSFIQEFLEKERLLPVLYEGKWNKSENAWAVDSQEAPTFWDASNRFRNKIMNVTEDKKTGMVTLSILWKNPEQASQWCDALLDLLNKKIRNRIVREAEQTKELLEKELNKTELSEVKSVIYSLIETQIKNIALAGARNDQAFRVVDGPNIPDLDDFIYPNYKANLVVAIVIGFVLGATVVRVVSSFDKPSVDEKK